MDTTLLAKEASPTDAEHTVKPRSHYRKRKKRHRLIRLLPPQMVFWLTLGLSAMTAVLTFIGGVPFISANVLACVLTIYVVYVNDKKGFSKKDPRRTTFSTVEALILGVLVLINITVVAWVLIR